MKKRDIAILIGLAVVVVLVAWYFLIIGPRRDEISELERQVQTEKTTYEEDAAKVERIDQERTAARQTSGELIKLNKLIPADAQVPSLIVELQQTANESGIDFMRIEPSDAFAGSDGNTIVPFTMQFQGNFFDVNDFLYRVENYARLEGNDVNVTGRLVSVVTLEIAEPDLDPKFPEILVTLGMNAFMSAPPPVSAATASSRTADSGSEGSGQEATAGS